MAYIMQGAFIPFLKNIVEKQAERRDAILNKLINIMWGLMEVGYFVVTYDTDTSLSWVVAFVF